MDRSAALAELESKIGYTFRDAALLETALTRLNPREQRIMKLRFGLGGASERTQKEVADILGISQSYISRLEKRILFRLRKELARMA
jgi:RNA polymerase sporulation-specific sigma factor